jgi:5'-nucleotidase
LIKRNEASGKFIVHLLQFISQAGNVEFRDEVESIKAEVERIREREPDVRIFIALGHSGFEMDRKIAASVPDIDAVIGGHTNTFLYSGKCKGKTIPVTGRGGPQACFL